ncbi:MAG: 50S ribosomal protein L32e [Candidatus Lokiarchaeota archaeon]|nr:50S ribosomal protein L32e [Candidatus Lokiarchaeota archaeon]
MTNTETKRLLKERENIQKKKPSFKRIESWRYKRVHGGWRAAKGIDSKTRQKLKSGVKSPNVGYRSPKKVRGLHPSGLIEVHLTHIEELENLDPKVHGIKISSRIGIKKRLKLVEDIQAKGFKVLNLGIPYVELLQIKEEPEEKKKKKKAKKKSSRKKKSSKKSTSKK